MFYLIIFKLQADETNPLEFTIEDVFFTGVLRMLAGLDYPKTVPNICTHFNRDDKISKLTAKIGQIKSYV